ncbi:MAG: tyrosine-type recombinase/integrase [Desulfotomaculales bacterium]
MGRISEGRGSRCYGATQETRGFGPCWPVGRWPSHGPGWGGLPLHKLQPLHVQEYYERDLKEGPRDAKKSLPRSLSPTTVNMHHRILHRALAQAVKWRLIAANPCDAVDPPRPEKKKPPVVPVGDALALLDAIADTPYHTPAMLARYCGLRMGEAMGLRWEDVDFENRRLSIRQILYQRKVGEPIFKAPKTAGSCRVVVPPQVAVEALKAHRKRQLEWKLAAGRAWQDTGLVCTMQDGTPINPPTLASWFRAQAHRRGLEISFHDLRHLHATYLLQLGVHPKVVAEDLGHSTTRLTLDTYSRVAPTLQREAADRLDALLRGNM